MHPPSILCPWEAVITAATYRAANESADCAGCNGKVCPLSEPAQYRYKNRPLNHVAQFTKINRYPISELGCDAITKPAHCETSSRQAREGVSHGGEVRAFNLPKRS